MDGIDFDSTEDNGITGQMETIMASIKRDVKRQLDTVRRKGGEMRVVPILKPVLGDGVHFVDEDYTHVVILGPVKNAGSWCSLARNPTRRASMSSPRRRAGAS